jgi:hypothetical protein
MSMKADDVTDTLALALVSIRLRQRARRAQTPTVQRQRIEHYICDLADWLADRAWDTFGARPVAHRHTTKSNVGAKRSKTAFLLENDRMLAPCLHRGRAGSHLAYCASPQSPPGVD